MLIPTTAEAFVPLDEDPRDRRRRKTLERAAHDRVLDSWERYRALADHCDRLLDLTELYDRKTRFALLILGGLNALNLLVVARTDLVASLQRGGSLMGVYAGCHTLLSLCLLLHAIAALKPRPQDASGHDEESGGGRAAGPRLVDGIGGQSVQEYCDRWRDAQIGQITRELSVVAFARAQTNAVKVRALHRVYVGLYVLVALTALLCVGLASPVLHRVFM